MPRPGEHIHRLHLPHLISPLGQGVKIPRQRLGVAGDIDHAGGCQLQEAVEELAAAARAGRIGDHHVGGLPLGGHGLHELPRVGGVEGCVRDAVAPGVVHSVCHRVAVDLHADDLLGRGGHGQSDGAGAAVGVDDRLLARQGGEFLGLSVQNFGLDGVDLVEGAGADAEVQPAESVGDEALPVEDVALVTEEQGGIGGIDVAHHRGDLGVTADQLVDKGALGAELPLGGNQHHHDLPADKALSYEDVPQKALSRFQVVGFDLHGGAELADGGQDGGGAGVLQHTVLHLHDAAGGRLVDP